MNIDQEENENNEKNKTEEVEEVDCKKLTNDGDISSEDEGEEGNKEEESDEQETLNAHIQIRYSEPSSPSYSQLSSPTGSSSHNLLIEKGSSSSENDPNILTKSQSPLYLQVRSIQPEELSINCVDEIFLECSMKYHLFVTANEKFTAAVLKFMEAPCFEEYKTSLENCFEAYKQMLQVSPNQG